MLNSVHFFVLLRCINQQFTFVEKPQFIIITFLIETQEYLCQICWQGLKGTSVNPTMSSFVDKPLGIVFKVILHKFKKKDTKTNK